MNIQPKNKIIIFSKSLDAIREASIICRNIGCMYFTLFDDQKIESISGILNLEIRDIKALHGYKCQDIIVLNYFDDDSGCRGKILAT